MDAFWNYGPILILLAVIVIVVRILPKIDLGHSPAFVKRRRLNWVPLGLTYAFLYMGLYNLTVSKNYLPQGLMTKEDFGTIFFWGTLTYGCAFVINGPLTDKLGGRKTILLAAAGAAAANAALGLVVLSGITENVVLIFSLLYATNMYFQSFGAVSIVKVNAHWFHLRERGAFGGIFGILISLGIFFAFDVGGAIAKAAPTHWVFFVPAIMLGLFFVASFAWVRDSPGDAGFDDFDTADASSGDDGPRLPVVEVFKKMLSNPIILTIAAIEFCSGFLRQAIMQTNMIYAIDIRILDTFVPPHWGMLLCCAGIFGGMMAGQISDRLFDSRRGPVASVLYGAMFLGSLVVFFVLDSAILGWIVIFMSLCIIGVHGMLSGTASMDFGGRKNVGVAVGIIDGFVYLGTAAQALLLGKILPSGDLAKDPHNWGPWPLAMAPVAFIGLLFATRVWNARPGKKADAPGQAATARAAAMANTEPS
ncbi:MAG: MFS transporter [Myxococcales bacterium]|nr:MFS transporter [Myxococcales bacterium]